MAQPLPIVIEEHEWDETEKTKYFPTEDEVFEEHEEVKVKEDEEYYEDEDENEDVDDDEEEEAEPVEKEEPIAESFTDDDVSAFIRTSLQKTVQYEYPKKSWEEENEECESEYAEDVDVGIDPKEIENEDDDIFKVPEEREPEPEYDTDWDEQHDGIRIGDERFMALIDGIQTESPYIDYVPKITKPPAEAMWELWDRLDYQAGRWVDEDGYYPGPLPETRGDVERLRELLKTYPEDIPNNP